MTGEHCDRCGKLTDERQGEFIDDAEHPAYNKWLCIPCVHEYLDVNGPGESELRTQLMKEGKI